LPREINGPGDPSKPPRAHRRETDTFSEFHDLEEQAVTSWRDDPKLVTAADLRRASAFLAHYSRSDLQGINAVLADVGSRTSYFLLALMAFIRHVSPEWCEPPAAELWEQAAATMATGLRDGGDDAA
jgi:hypothetical protein